MEWISIKDKMPKNLDTILIYDEVSDLTISIGSKDNKGFLDWVSDEYVNITHWISIPSPLIKIH